MDPEWILLLDSVFACSDKGLGFFGKKSKYIYIFFFKSVFIHVLASPGVNKPTNQWVYDINISASISVRADLSRGSAGICAKTCAK